MNRRTALASIAVVTWVLVIGSLADFDDAYSRTAFALQQALARNAQTPLGLVG